MPAFTLHPLDAATLPGAQRLILRDWGALCMVSRGVLYDVFDYPGVAALIDGQVHGVVTYRVEDTQCEVLILHSDAEGMGIGSALMVAVEDAARAAGCQRLWLITTNDNLHALGWYQKRGFTLAALHANALAESRRLKPEIPLIGNDGIPLRDELELEKAL